MDIMINSKNNKKKVRWKVDIDNYTHVFEYLKLYKKEYEK